jgi:hypothetical protein
MADPIFSQEEMDVWTYMKKGLVKTRKTTLGDIHIDLEGGYIHFIQRWKYVWVLDRGAPAWSNQDQVDYHYLLKSEIWADWNSDRPLPPTPADPATDAIVRLLNQHNGVVFKVSGHADFAKKFAGVYVPIHFDVLLTVKHPHWTIRVRKLAPGKKQRDNVDTTHKTIHLNYANTGPHTVCTEVKPQTCQADFLTPTHEFGHTFGNGDEYKGGKYVKDTDSIMNIGREVRARHFKWIEDQLNHMIPGCKFSRYRLDN